MALVHPLGQLRCHWPIHCEVSEVELPLVPSTWASDAVIEFGIGHDALHRQYWGLTFALSGLHPAVLVDFFRDPYLESLSGRTSLRWGGWCHYGFVLRFFRSPCPTGRALAPKHCRKAPLAKPDPQNKTVKRGASREVWLKLSDVAGSTQVPGLPSVGCGVTVFVAGLGFINNPHFTNKADKEGLHAQ